MEYNIKLPVNKTEQLIKIINNSIYFAKKYGQLKKEKEDKTLLHIINKQKIEQDNKVQPSIFNTKDDYMF